MEYKGKIVTIKGQIAEVQFDDHQPSSHTILVQENNPDVVLEVLTASGNDRFTCLILSSNSKLYRGAKVINTNKKLSLPMSKELLGRVLDIFGKFHDNLPPFEYDDSSLKPVFKSNPVELNNAIVPNKVIETGIKTIDFFTPLLEGGKIGLMGGAGVGKTILLSELINNIVIKKEGQKESVAIFSAVGERAREAQELVVALKNNNVLNKTCLVLGQMGENPAIRFRTAYAGISIAEYFRDDLSKNVLFFIDNIFRFAQAGHELSTIRNSIPSEDGYQPTLESEMSAFHERLSSTTSGTITAMEAIFVPSDDVTDYAVRSITQYLDNVIVLSRKIYQEGRLPAVDLLNSTSSALNPEIVGELHYDTYLEAKKLLEAANRIERIVSLVGESELSLENQQVYKRSKILKNFMTQSFFVASSQTGRIGRYIDREETVKGVKAILEGTFDKKDPHEFLFIGGVEEVS